MPHGCSGIEDKCTAALVAALGSRELGCTHRPRAGGYFCAATPVTSTWILRFTSSSAARRYLSMPQLSP